MKKVLTAILIACVVFGACAAFAQPQPENNEPMREHSNKPEFRNHRDMNAGHPGMFPPRHNGFGMRHSRTGRNFTPDMPKEIREKAVELAKLRVDLEEAVSSNPVNKAKAIEVYAKILKLEQEIKAWKFEKYLARIEEFRKNNLPPEPPVDDIK